MKGELRKLLTRATEKRVVTGDRGNQADGGGEIQKHEEETFQGILETRSPSSWQG